MIRTFDKVVMLYWTHCNFCASNIWINNPKLCSKVDTITDDTIWLPVFSMRECLESTELINVKVHAGQWIYEPKKILTNSHFPFPSQEAAIGQMRWLLSGFLSILPFMHWLQTTVYYTGDERIKKPLTRLEMKSIEKVTSNRECKCFPPTFC